MRTLLILMVFLILGALFIISNQNLALSEADNFQKFRVSYYSWFSHIFDNGKNLAGYVVKSEWLPSENNRIIDLNK